MGNLGGSRGVRDVVGDGRVERQWRDEGDVSAGFEEEVETRGGDDSAADKEDRSVLEAESEEQGSALVDFRIRFGRERGERSFLRELCSLDTGW